MTNVNQQIDLSLEQEFDLRLFAEQVQSLAPEQAKWLLVKLKQQMTIQDNLYRDLLKHYMGISTASMPL
jgi:hypothetical protein